MLSKQDLLAVTTIVTHGGDGSVCHDGMASALIARDALKEPRGTRESPTVEWVTHGTAKLRDFPAAPGQLWIDITPPRERVQEFVEAGALVLDHHKGQGDIVEAFGERGVYADAETEPGVSGAWLAFREIWERLRSGGRRTSHWADEVERFAELAGVRDTWQRQHKDWNAACAQAAALVFWPRERLIAEGLVGTIKRRLEIGSLLLERDAARNAAKLAGAWCTTVAGLRLVIFQGKGGISDIAETIGDDADLVMAFDYFTEGLRQYMAVDCRSRGAFSSLEMAKSLGGGGHVPANGFTLDVGLVSLLSNDSPYDVLEKTVWMFRTKKA